MLERKDYLAYFLEKSKEKNFDLSTIRKEMTAAQRPEEEIKSVVTAIDEVLVGRAMSSNGPEWYRNLKARGFRLSGSALTILGGALIALGLLLTGISFIKFQLGLNNDYYLHFGPMIWGFFVLLAGLARTSAEKRDSNRFMNKRFGRQNEDRYNELGEGRIIKRDILDKL